MRRRRSCLKKYRTRPSHLVDAVAAAMRANGILLGGVAGGGQDGPSILGVLFFPLACRRRISSTPKTKQKTRKVQKQESKNKRWWRQEKEKDDEGRLVAERESADYSLPWLGLGTGIGAKFYSNFGFCV